MANNKKKTNSKKQNKKKKVSKKAPSKSTRTTSTKKNTRKNTSKKKATIKNSTTIKEKVSKNSNNLNKKAPNKKTSAKKQVTKKKPIKKDETNNQIKVKKDWVIRIIYSFCVIILSYGFFNLLIKPSSKSSIYRYNTKEIVNDYKKEAKEKCLLSSDIPKEVLDKLQYLTNDLYKYMAQYNISLKYGEFNYDYELSYRDKEVYYGASLIKLVDAIYLIENDIDLNTTKKYERRFTMGYSSKVSKYKYGDMISLKDLIDYAIRVSDNSAHLMLIDYIGFENLSNYGKNLGAEVILTGGDLFGNQTAEDMSLYLRKAYELINTRENGPLIKDAMLNTEENYLNFDDVVIGHKYGSYNSFYHDVGIYFSDEPYYIVVLSTLDRNRKVITEVSKKVYNIHNSLLSLKTDYCNNLYK